MMPFFVLLCANGADCALLSPLRGAGAEVAVLSWEEESLLPRLRACLNRRPDCVLDAVCGSPGFGEAWSACADAGVPYLPCGDGAEEDILALLAHRYGLSLRAEFSSAPEPARRHFPLFVDLTGQLAVVVGAGKIAARRVRTLLQFGCRVQVIATEIGPEIAALAVEKALKTAQRDYMVGDTDGAALVVAATNSREVNFRVGCASRRAGTPVSVADRREECTFFFPAVAVKGPLVVGVTASGTDHTLARIWAQRIRTQLQGAQREHRGTHPNRGGTAGHE